jgi:hypothetical protein
MSLGMMVTRLAWIAQRLVSSNSEVRYASDASCRAMMACDWKRRSVLKSWATSRTRRWKGSLRIRSSVDFWYLRISRSATVPGLKRWGFLTPPVDGADLRAAFEASCLRGACHARGACQHGVVRALELSLLAAPAANWQSGAETSHTHC